MNIRHANISDLASITDIFNYYIQHTNARFEETPFTLANRESWFAQFSYDSKHQLYVAIENQSLLGFACSQPYRDLAAFENTVEVSVYLTASAKGRGVGSRLYAQLFSSLAQHNVHRALSAIALPNDASLSLHKRFGFKEVGVFNEYAKKKGRYISSMWLEKIDVNL